MDSRFAILPFQEAKSHLRDFKDVYFDGSAFSGTTVLLPRVFAKFFEADSGPSAAPGLAGLLNRLETEIS